MTVKTDRKVRLLLSGSVAAFGLGTAAAPAVAQAPQSTTTPVAPTPATAPAPAPAQAPAATPDTAASAPATSDVGDIVVTAQKRSQSINSVPMSILAATGDQLQQAGVKAVADLVKITPGFNVGTSTRGTPVYTLRGVGYNDFALSARPAVTIYSDEALLPFTPEGRGATLDVERVEVLKGPQGTLFGSNSTGGAINFVAAKPTVDTATGASVEYGRFNRIDAQTYLSGPLVGDVLTGRIALQVRNGNDWQRSYTRKDKLGDIDFLNGRFILAFKPNAPVRAWLTVSAWRDHSETTAGQLAAITPSVPPFFNRTGLATYPLAPADPRAADWNPGLSYKRDDRLVQTTGRIEWDFAPDTTLTSLSTYTDYKARDPYDNDGTSLFLLNVTQDARAKSYAQELRVTSKFDGLSLTAGANYGHDRVLEDTISNISDSSVAYSFTVRGPKYAGYDIRKDEKVQTYAVFGNAEYELTRSLTVQGGVRYTNYRDRFQGCSADPGDNRAAAAFTLVINATRRARGLAPLANAIPLGGCYTLNSAFEPALFNYTLKEDNVSWRGGLQYRVARGTLLYGNVSRGYKQGGFPSVTATSAPGLLPATQEWVTAYEVGTKTDLTRNLHVNSAIFYYDYRQKQITGTVVDPLFGPIPRSLNIPKSRIWGADLQVIARPFEGLNLTASAGYTNAEVNSDFFNANALGVRQNFNGTALPDAPKWQLTGDAEYKRPISETLAAFVGGNAYHASQTWTGLGEVAAQRLKPYTRVDLRAGIESRDGRWSAYIWGRNVFDELYYRSATRLIDDIVRYTGEPATYGITLTARR